MGDVCSRDKTKDLPPEPEEVQPSYESACQEMERRFILPTISIKQIVDEVNEAEYNDKSFSVKSVAKIYAKHGVLEENFLADKSIYRELFESMFDPDTDCRPLLLSVCLPFCEGTANEKKEVLWNLLRPNENRVNYATLAGTVNFVVVLSVGIIPRIVLDHTKADGHIPDDVIVTLAEVPAQVIDVYARKYMPEVTPTKGDGETAKESEEGMQDMHRYEFDLWLAKIDPTLLFSPKRLRADFWNFVEENRAKIALYSKGIAPTATPN